ncbi:OmpP1/FadL family transporter [Mariniflexile gromovii]|uniref:Outer membrane protein transport protein n=1 Tax=Mariniflexile gromovii TaxID=362523 RepID=A0ABS4BUU7_9FLAO|nr:outer membrane protein transport protein [Mariniflexile gromovii]MBP0904341.1 outer membrane protein transport protein [Mariniflexile gromovii]
MKKLNLLFIGMLSVCSLSAQDITDALRYSQSEIQGTARFRALSGAFGALGGDMSAVSINPASSAVFSQSHASFSFSNVDTSNDTQYFNGLTSSNISNFDINQGGAAFVFENRSNSPWRKFSIGIAYDRTNNYDDNWSAVGTNTNDDVFIHDNDVIRSPANSIAGYFFLNANGKRLDQISTLPGESIADAYSDIGNVYGFGHQQAFLGFESFILEADDIDDDSNTLYSSNLASGNFLHDYSYVSTGYNGKISFNLATQYEDNLYLGLNLNSHFIDYQKSTQLFERNSNSGSLVKNIDFKNNLSTTGNGFSFQLGGIIKLSPEFRLGVAFDSPTWYTITEETTQYLSTVHSYFGPTETKVINPQTVNVYPQYKLQTPSKLTGSLAYVFGTQGLLSFDYSRKNYSNTKFKPTSDPFFADQNAAMSNILTDASTYRLGGEYKIKQLSLRGGYRFEESPYKDGVTVGDLSGYSVGIGYSFGNTKLDVTYDQASRTNETPLYNVGLTDAAVIDRTNSNVTLSLSFNI